VIVRGGDEMTKKPNKPGEEADRSGIYKVVGPRGGDTGVERTVVEGEPFPPTPEPRQKYVLRRPTKTNRK